MIGLETCVSVPAVMVEEMGDLMNSQSSYPDLSSCQS